MRLISILLLCLPVMVQAQDRGGVIALRGLHSDAVQTAAVFGDFTLSTDPSRPLAARLGMFGVVGRLHETYADLRIHGGGLDYDIGFPRPAYDDFVMSPVMRIMPRYGLETVGLSRSRTTYGTMSQTKYLPYGLTIRNAGDLRFAASWHGVPDYGDTVLGLGLGADKGPWHVQAAFELVHGPDAINAKLGAAYDLGTAFTAGLNLFAPDANGLPRAAEVYGDWHDDHGHAVTAALRMTPGTAQTLLAFGGHMEIGRALALDLGVATDHGTWAIEMGTSYRF